MQPSHEKSFTLLHASLRKFLRDRRLSLTASEKFRLNPRPPIPPDTDLDKIAAQSSVVPTLDDLPRNVQRALALAFHRNLVSIKLQQEYKQGASGRLVDVEIGCGEYAPRRSLVSEPKLLYYAIVVGSPGLCSAAELKLLGAVKYFGTWWAVEGGSNRRGAGRERLKGVGGEAEGDAGDSAGDGEFGGEDGSAGAVPDAAVSTAYIA